MDKKAKKILLQLYWKGGWTDEGDRHLSTEDFEYAKSKGVMFAPISIDHDACVDALIKLRDQISIEDICKAFMSSLSSRRLDLRSSLSSYFLAHKFEAHQYRAIVSGTSYEGGVATHSSSTCQACRDYQYGMIGDEAYDDADLNVLNFERIKWGGVRHGELLYTMFDLRQFAQESLAEPTQEDATILRDILQVIKNSAPDDYPSALEKGLNGALKSSKSERQVLIEILAAIGVLKPARYDRPIKGRNDWVFSEYWRGEDGYDEDRVVELFGAYLDMTV